MMCSMEMFYIVSAILVGTVAVNVAIALMRTQSTSKSRLLPDAHWERRLNENDAHEITTQLSQARNSRAHSSTTATRGYLNGLITRSHVIAEKKVDEEDMISEVEQTLGHLRQKYDQVTYLGKHTAHGREGDSCLYARHRVNGFSKCDGEIASLVTNQHVVLLQVNVNAADAQLIQEEGWGVSSPMSKLAKLCGAATLTQVMVPMPRNSEELQTVIVPILEAAICCVAGIEQLA